MSLTSVLLFASLMHIQLAECGTKGAIWIRGAKGPEVINDVITEIEKLGIITKNKQIREFLEKTPYFNGEYWKDASYLNAKGIWPVIAEGVDYAKQKADKRIRDAIKTGLGIDFETVKQEHMDIPIYNGLVYSLIFNLESLTNPMLNDPKFESKRNSYKCDKNKCGRGFCYMELNGEQKCLCEVPFIGKDCNTLATSCRNVECGKNGRCVDDYNSKVECQCDYGYTGRYCTYKANDCSEIICENGGSCVENVPKCQCQSLDSGDYCQKKGAPCKSNVCRNGGECKKFDGKETCECPYTHKGDKCQIKKTCDQNPCKNGGTCYLDNTGYISCNCEDDYEGSLCETKVELF